MKLLAIDPGTFVLGLAVFHGPDLVRSLSLEPPAKAAVETRLAFLMAGLNAMVSLAGIEAIAMERPGAGNPAHRPPSLLTLCTFVRQAAKREWKVPVAEYATGTITAAVRLRGMKGDRKDLLRAGVVALYGEKYRQAPQDVVDAVACGHCHLMKLREKELA